MNRWLDGWRNAVELAQDLGADLRHRWRAQPLILNIAKPLGSAQFIEAAEEAFERAGQPIVNLHRVGSEPAFAVLVEIDLWRQLSDRHHKLVGHYGHIQGDERIPLPRTF